MEEKERYISDITSEDCYLCGEPQQSLLPYYKGQTNLGIISMNTFQVVPISINRYDDYGRLIKESAGSMSMTYTSTGEGGFRAYVSPDTDRGYANVTIYFNDDQALDMEKAASFLCADCLNAIMNDCWDDEYYGVGLINFSTNEIRLLEKNVLSFMEDDFYVSCDLKEHGEEDDSLEVRLLVFHCPKRYS